MATADNTAGDQKPAVRGEVIAQDVPIAAAATVYGGIGSLRMTQRIGEALHEESGVYTISHSVGYEILKVRCVHGPRVVAVELDLRDVIQQLVNLAENTMNGQHPTGAQHTVDAPARTEETTAP